MATKNLKLGNQLCFPIYALSRMITKTYRPYLDKLGITYPQYLVLMVLWEKNELTVKEISLLLYLESNTLTPLLKRMEKNGIIKRERSQEDERSVIITLTAKGITLQKKAEKMYLELEDEKQSGTLTPEESDQLRKLVWKAIK